MYVYVCVFAVFVCVCVYVSSRYPLRPQFMHTVLVNALLCYLRHFAERYLYCIYAHTFSVWYEIITICNNYSKNIFIILRTWKWSHYKSCDKLKMILQNIENCPQNLSLSPHLGFVRHSWLVGHLLSCAENIRLDVVISHYFADDVNRESPVRNNLSKHLG